MESASGVGARPTEVVPNRHSGGSARETAPRMKPLHLQGRQRRVREQSFRQGSAQGKPLRATHKTFAFWTR